MAVNPYYFANASGLGPQSGGFSPTPSDKIQAPIRQASGMGLMEHALASDPASRALSGLLVTGLAGNPAQAANMLRNSTQGQLIKDLASIAMSSGLIPGGNPMQLAASVQQMMATQGFSVGGQAGRGSPIFGGGAITDLISKSVFDSVKANFYDSVTGLSRRSAHGLDKSQMAEAMGQLTARGAFSGMNIGSLDFNAQGKVEFNLDKEKMKKVNQTFSDYAAMLKDARQIFGDLPIAELTQNAERLVGTSLREVGSIGAMRNKMANIQSLSSAFGFKPDVVANRMMQVTDTLQMQMFAQSMQDPRMAWGFNQAGAASGYGKVAAGISERSVAAGLAGGLGQTAAANRYAEQGKFMPTMGASEITQALSAGAIAIMNEDPEVTGNVLPAQMLLDTGKIKDPAKAAQVKNLITEMGKTGDINQTKALNRQLAAVLGSAGYDVNRIKEAMPQSEMLRRLSHEGSAAYTNFAFNAAKYRPVMEGLENISETGMDFGMFRRGEAGDANRRAFTDMFMAVDKEAQDALFGTVGANGEIDEKALNDVYANMPGLARVFSKDKFKETVKRLASDPARAKGNLKDQMSAVMQEMHSSAGMAVGPSAREQFLAEERGVQNYLKNISLGEGLDQEDFRSQLMRGFFGAGKVGSNEILQSLKNKDKLTSFEINQSKTGLNIDADGVDRLTNTIGAKNMEAVAKRLGIDPKDKKALAQALSKPEGFLALQANLGGGVMGVNADGTLGIAGADQVDAETQALETEAMITAAERLLGPKADIGGDLTTVEGRAKYNTDMLNELTKNKGAKISELSDKFKTGGYGGQDYEALKAIYGSNPEVRKALLDSASKLENAGGTDNIAKANDIRNLDRQLQASTGGGSNFLGVLQIMSDGLAQLQLYKES